MSNTLVRRTTLIVSDMSAARHFYEDILGMSVYYDDEFQLTGVGMPAPDPHAKTHLVILKCEDPYIGMIGLVQIMDPPPPPPGPQKDTVGIGDIVLIFDVPDVDAIYEKMQAAGSRIHSRPHDWEVDLPDGSRKKLRSLGCFDPDGYFVDLNTEIG